MGKIRIILSIMLTLCALRGYASNPAELLINTFGSQCKNVAGFTANTTLLLSSFKGALESLRDSNSCNVGVDQNALISAFDQSYTNFELYKGANADRLKSETMVADLTSYLYSNQGSLSDDEMLALETSIFENQGNIIAYNSEIARYDYLAQGNERNLYSAIGVLSDLFEKVGNNPQCVDQGFQGLTSLVSSGLSLSSMLATGGNSLYLAAAGVFVDQFSTFIRNSHYNKLIKDSDAILWPEAIRCTSEAFVNDYCSATENISLIENYINTYDEDDFKFKGVELINRDLIGLDKWLKEVYAGAPFSSQGDLDNREKPILQAELVQKVQRYIQTFNEIKLDELDRLDRSLLHGAVVGNLNSLVSIMESPKSLTTSDSPYSTSDSSDLENPIFIGRTADDLKFLLVGLDPFGQYCRDSQGVARKCSSFNEYLLVNNVSNYDKGTWEDIYSRAAELAERVLRDVNILRAQTVNFDPIGVFVNSKRKSKTVKNAYDGLVSVIENAQRIYDYVYVVACEDEPEFCFEGEPTFMNSYFLRLVDVLSTLELTSQIKSFIEEVSNPRPITDVPNFPDVCKVSPDSNIINASIKTELEEKAFILSNCITELLQLSQRGNDIYFTKIRSMVSAELNILVYKEEFSEEERDLILSATRTDLVKRLVDIYDTNSDISYREILTGLDSRRDISRRTMHVFFKKFRTKMLKILKNKTVSRRVKDDLCFRVIPFIPDSTNGRNFIRSAYLSCQDVVLKDLRNGPELKWTDYINKRSFNAERDDRICSLFRFNKKNALIRQGVLE